MKACFWSVVIWVLTAFNGFAQVDSIAVVNAHWNKEKISRGINLKTFWFKNRLFNSNQNISVLEIKNKGRYVFDIGFDAQKLIKTSEFGKQSNAIAALNGTFFDVTNGGSVDFIKSNGEVINENRIQKNEKRTLHQKSAVVINNGKLFIKKWNGNPDWEKTILAESIMTSGPLLIFNETDEKLDTANTFNKSRHPRSAIALTKNNRILLVTIDGRHENSAGMSLFELRKLLGWLKATDAINLDGGGSTTLWVKNKVVNYPSDNKKWDHEGERKVANVILLKKK
jgi:exopolysaccharide biosynthesis protein